MTYESRRSVVTCPCQTNPLTRRARSSPCLYLHAITVLKLKETHQHVTINGQQLDLAWSAISLFHKLLSKELGWQQSRANRPKRGFGTTILTSEAASTMTNEKEHLLGILRTVAWSLTRDTLCQLQISIASDSSYYTAQLVSRYRQGTPAGNYVCEA